MKQQGTLIVTDIYGQRRYPLLDKVTLGREKCQVLLTDAKASRTHCTIEEEDGKFFVRDLKSRNGTLLNGQALQPNEPTPLKHRDTITIGATLLVLELGYEDSAESFPRDPSSVLQFLETGDVQASQEADPSVLSLQDAKSSDISQLRRAAERLKALIDISQAISRAAAPGQLLAFFLDKLFEVVPHVERGVILIYGSGGTLDTVPPDELDLDLDRDKEPRPRPAQVTVRCRNPEDESTEIKLSRNIVQRLKEGRKSYLFSLNADKPSDSSTSAVDVKTMADTGSKSLMCAPLLAGEHDLGFVQLETSMGHAFKKEDLSVLTALAGQVALLHHNTELTFQAAKDAANRESMRRFLAPALADRLLKGQLTAELGGTETNGTIFYSDIVGFTRMGGKMSPKNIVTLLNRYLKVMQNIIFRRGGSVDKCAGDQIMAFWGVLDEGGIELTANAVATGVEMQIALFEFNRNEALKKDKDIVLPPVPLGHGIGINSGTVCAGNIGSEHKIEFTVIGDVVNVAARIEAMAGRGQIFVGESTFNEIKDRALCFDLPACPAKGVEKPVRIYCVRGIVAPVIGTPGIPPTQNFEPPHLNDMLFCMPCTLHFAESSVPAIVTGIFGGSPSMLVLQTEQFVPEGTVLRLEWALPEKRSLPNLQGTVHRSQAAVLHSSEPAALMLPRASHPRRQSLVLAARQTGHMVAAINLPPGGLVLKVPQLPEEMGGWKPGLLLPSDLTDHTQIIRA